MSNRLDALEQQVNFICRSCEAYDRLQREDEAIRIATHLRVIFNSTRNSVSLIEQCRLEGEAMLSTSSFLDGHQLGFGLIDLYLNRKTGETSCHPCLDIDTYPRLIPMQKWWDEEIVIKYGEKALTRRDIVRTMVDKDGGAHVDPGPLPPEYIDLKRFGGIRIMDANQQKQLFPRIEVKNGHFASVRQMAYELLHTRGLLRHLKGKLKLSDPRYGAEGPPPSEVFPQPVNPDDLIHMRLRIPGAPPRI